MRLNITGPWSRILKATTIRDYECLPISAAIAVQSLAHYDAEKVCHTAYAERQDSIVKSYAPNLLVNISSDSWAVRCNERFTPSRRRLQLNSTYGM